MCDNKTNILIIFTGAVRECIDDINTNIKTCKSSFDEKVYNVQTVFSTWYPVKKSIDTQYDYDTENLNLQIKNEIDYEIFFEQQEINKYAKTQNGMTAVQNCHLRNIAQSLQDMNLNVDYVMVLRNDLLFKMDNINKYLTTGFHVPKVFWGNHGSPSSINDHIFLCPYSNFLRLSNFTDEDLHHMAESSHDGETLRAKILSAIDSSINIINDDDIVKCVLKRRTEGMWGWKK